MTCQSYTRQIHHRTATRRELRFNPRNHAAQKEAPKTHYRAFHGPTPREKNRPKRNQQPKKAKPSMIAYIPIPEHNPPEEHTPQNSQATPPDTTQHPRGDMPIHTTQVPQGKHHPTLPGHRTPPKLHKAAGTCHYPHLRFPLLRKPEIPRPREQLSRKQHNWNARKQPNN
jgi:hypothetical protein